MKAFDYGIVSNPEIFKEGVLKAHSDHRAYASVDELEEGASSLMVSLNGQWKFHYAKEYSATIPGFEKAEYDCRSWDEIKVPFHIQLEGYDIPSYVNYQYPWDGHEDIEFGEIPTKFNPVGSYVKYFTLPLLWENKEVHIVFDGVESGYALWLNGSYVGYSEDSFTPSEFDLTPFLKTGENKLAVQVFKYTSGSWFEDQDFFRFSGIYRNVFLKMIPDSHLEDIKVRTLLNEDFSEAELEVTLRFTGNGVTDYELLRYGHTVLKGTVVNSEEVVISRIVADPVLWSAEDPQLYQLILHVNSDKDELCEVIRQNIGFRKFELKNGLMLINGKRIVFKGVNRHEFSCDKGRVVSEEDTLKDIITMKRNNINAIRTSHYQNSSKIYELCDIYGLYMIAENNMETHGTWTYTWDEEERRKTALPGDRKECMEVMLDRINSTYQLDKNHPSVLIWSIGNESFGGEVTHEMSMLFRKLDPDRLVHYEGIFNDRRYNDTSDMESQMYSSVKNIEKYLAEHNEKPFICCEYTHAMGNSCGAMFKYTELADREPRYQGGFIWDYVDQAIRKKNRFGEDYMAYGGDFGERPCDYNFSGNGIVDANREPYAKMQEVKYNYRDIKVYVDERKVRIVNTSLFTGTWEYDCEVILYRDGKEILRKRMATDVEPLSEKEYDLPEAIIDKMMVAGTGAFDENGPFPLDEYVITVSFRLRDDTLWANRGHEVSFGQGIFRNAAATYITSSPMEVVHGTYNIGVKGKDFSVLFSKDKGNIVSYNYGGKELLEGLPRPNFWRAPVDNDRGNREPQRYAQWKIASMYATSQLEEVSEEDNSVSVSYRFTLPTTPESTVLITYMVTGDGRVWVKEDYDPNEELSPMPEYGMLFRFSADFENVEYYGKGPEENYVDRCKGAKLGVFNTTTKKSVENYLRPQETGNRVDVRWAKITDDKGRGILFEAPDTMNFSAIPYTPEELEAAAHPYELPRVCKTIARCSLMQMGIAGDDTWGSKTHEEFLLPSDKPLSFVFSFKGL